MIDKNKTKIDNLMLKLGYIRLLLKRYWLLMLLLCVAGGILGGIIAYSIYTPEYTVTQAFTIDVAEHPGANAATVSENQLSKTIPSLLSSNTFLDYMDSYIKASGVKGKFRVTSLEYSNIFYLTAVSHSNDGCMKIIDEIQNHYSDIADYVIGKSTMKFMAPPSYSSLPSNTPNYTIGIITGVLLIFVAFSVILIIKARFTETVTSAKDIEKDINAPCLAEIHSVYRKRRSGDSKKDRFKIPLVTNDDSGIEFRQEISTLSSNINKICTKKNCKSILVTSTVSGEGKSSVSLNLACDLADKGNRVIIIDCDLRMPCIAKLLDINNISMPLSKAIVEKEYNKCIVKTDINRLYFAGNIQSDNAAFEDTASSSFNSLIKELKQNFDYVILDSPPSSFLGDALAIGEIADGFIYIISYNCISKSYVLRSLSSFDEAKSEMLGFVINRKS